MIGLVVRGEAGGGVRWAGLVLCLFVFAAAFAPSARAQDTPASSPAPPATSARTDEGLSAAELPNSADELQSRLKALRAERDKLNERVKRLDDFKTEVTRSIERAEAALNGAKDAAKAIDGAVDGFKAAKTAASEAAAAKDADPVDPKEPKVVAKAAAETKDRAAKVGLDRAVACTSLVAVASAKSRKVQAVVPIFGSFFRDPDSSLVQLNRTMDDLTRLEFEHVYNRNVESQPTDQLLYCQDFANEEPLTEAIAKINFVKFKADSTKAISDMRDETTRKIEGLNAEERLLRAKLEKISRQATDVIVPVLLAVPLFMVLLFVTTLLFNRETQRRILELRTIVELGGLAAILMTIIVLGIKEMIEKAALAALVGSIIGYVFNQQARRLNEDAEARKAADKGPVAGDGDEKRNASPTQGSPQGAPPSQSQAAADAATGNEGAGSKASEGPDPSADDPARHPSQPTASLASGSPGSVAAPLLTTPGRSVGVARAADDEFDDEVGPRSRAWFMLTIGIASALSTVALAETTVSVSWLMVGAACIVIGACWGLRSRWSNPRYVVLGGVVLSLGMVLVAYAARVGEGGAPASFELWVFDVPREIPYNWLLLPVALILVAKALTTLLSAPSSNGPPRADSQRGTKPPQQGSAQPIQTPQIAGSGDDANPTQQRNP